MYRVYFNNKCKNDLTPSAIFSTLEEATDYIKKTLPKMRDFMTDGQVYQLRPFCHKVTITRSDCN